MTSGGGGGAGGGTKLSLSVGQHERLKGFAARLFDDTSWEWRKLTMFLIFLHTSNRMDGESRRVEYRPQFAMFAKVKYFPDR